MTSCLTINDANKMTLQLQKSLQEVKALKKKLESDNSYQSFVNSLNELKESPISFEKKLVDICIDLLKKIDEFQVNSMKY